MPPHLLALLLATATAAAPPPAAGLPPHLVLLFIADLGGYLEPCGCSLDQRGGLPRLATLVARIRAEGAPVLLVGGGDLLFEVPPDPQRRDQDVEKARVLADVLLGLGLAATLAGERDLYLGEPFARATGLPFGEGVVLGGLLAVGPPGRVPAAPIRVGLVHAGGTRAALPLAGRARAEGLALLLASHRETLITDDFDRALLDAPVPVVQVQGRGQSLARLDLYPRGDLARGFLALPGPSQRDEELSVLSERRAAYRTRRVAAEREGGDPALARALAGKLAELEAREAAVRATPLPEPPVDRPSLRVTFLPLDGAVPDDPAVRARLAVHYRAVGQANLARARRAGERCPPPRPGEAAHVGAAACAACHAAATAAWASTRHARAYETLVRVGRALDLDCVRCHVTGWKEPGGACGVTTVEGRTGVQCEACHGPASAHLADPSRPMAAAVPSGRCRACHTPEASTAFDDAAYRRRLLVPGHGQPSLPMPR